MDVRGLMCGHPCERFEIPHLAPWISPHLYRQMKRLEEELLAAPSVPQYLVVSHNDVQPENMIVHDDGMDIHSDGFPLVVVADKICSPIRSLGPD